MDKVRECSGNCVFTVTLVSEFNLYICDCLQDKDVFRAKLKFVLDALGLAKAEF